MQFSFNVAPNNVVSL